LPSWGCEITQAEAWYPLSAEGAIQDSLGQAKGRFRGPRGYPYDQAILIQWLKEWDGRPARLFCSSDTGGTPVPLCVYRPEHVFTALNTNKAWATQAGTPCYIALGLTVEPPDGALQSWLLLAHFFPSNLELMRFRNDGPHFNGLPELKTRAALGDLYGLLKTVCLN
jgi:hypothetical protein